MSNTRALWNHPPVKSHEKEWTCWYGQPDNKHTWAFAYWCRRQGDVVYVKGDLDDAGRSVLHVGIKRKLR